MNPSADIPPDASTPVADSAFDASDPSIDPVARLRHDLRTPAAHIQGYAEMLQEEAVELGLTGWLPDLRRIEEAGRRLVELIRQELAPERIEKGSADLRHIHAELRTPLNHAIGYSEILMEQASSDPALRLVPDLQRIQAAAQSFLRLLDSLLQPGLLTTGAPVGPAVAPSARPDALALTRSAPGVPASPSGAPVLSPAFPSSPALSPSSSLTPSPLPSIGGRLLVVDDDAGNVELLARRLTRQGYEVVTATDGAMALRRLGPSQPRIDLVLLDMIMPGLNGDQVLAELKADPALRDIPVIMLSALDEMDSVVRCILMGAEDYLAKPYNPVLLRARINACLEKSRLREHEQTYLRALELERQKSETLLRNILPQPIADRLKLGETTIVDALAEVTVLFADVVGFTAMSHRVNSVDLVRFLDELFTGFDRLAELQGLEKIKTIGDSYMVVGGLPAPREDHAVAVAELALGMLKHVGNYQVPGAGPIQLRIGINTGPVVAGIIGRTKFSYDLWGDTVNLASRMESLSQPGCIQVTESVHRALGDRYSFEPRGMIDVKGRGSMPAWFLKPAG